MNIIRTKLIIVDILWNKNSKSQGLFSATSAHVLPYSYNYLTIYALSNCLLLWFYRGTKLLWIHYYPKHFEIAFFHKPPEFFSLLRNLEYSAINPFLWFVKSVRNCIHIRFPVETNSRLVFGDPCPHTRSINGEVLLLPSRIMT